MVSIRKPPRDGPRKAPIEQAEKNIAETSPYVETLFGNFRFRIDSFIASTKAQTIFAAIPSPIRKSEATITGSDGSI